MATYYSPGNLRAASRLALVAAVALLLSLGAASAQPGTNFIHWAQNEFARTQKVFLADTNSVTNGWQFARACFDLAEAATNETSRASFARQGISACQSAIVRDPKSAPAHYYLAMNFGELAQAEAPSLAAYRLVHEVEREFKTAADLDEKFDHAGPARNLGALYFQAPGWPLSIGSKKKARDWFQRAATLVPEYPENQINLAEAHTRWRERGEAEKAFKALETLWPAVPANFSGVAWEKLRAEWSQRREENRANFKKVFKSDP
jgi:tetratricopeptide (TPR) repeat protein